MPRKLNNVIAISTFDAQITASQHYFTLKPSLFGEMTDANPGKKMYKMSLKHLLHQKVRKQILLSFQQKDSGANLNRFPQQPKMGI